MITNNQSDYNFIIPYRFSTQVLVSISLSNLIRPAGYSLLYPELGGTESCGPWMNPAFLMRHSPRSSQVQFPLESSKEDRTITVTTSSLVHRFLPCTSEYLSSDIWCQPTNILHTHSLKRKKKINVDAQETRSPFESRFWTLSLTPQG